MATFRGIPERKVVSVAPGGRGSGNAKAINIKADLSPIVEFFRKKQQDKEFSALLNRVVTGETTIPSDKPRHGALVEETLKEGGGVIDSKVVSQGEVTDPRLIEGLVKIASSKSKNAVLAGETLKQFIPSLKTRDAAYNQAYGQNEGTQDADLGNTQLSDADLEMFGLKPGTALTANEAKDMGFKVEDAVTRRFIEQADAKYPEVEGETTEEKVARLDKKNRLIIDLSSDRQIILDGTLDARNLREMEKDRISGEVLLGQLDEIDKNFRPELLTLPTQFWAEVQKITERGGKLVPKFFKKWVGTDLIGPMATFVQQGKDAFIKYRRWATGVAGGAKELAEIATAFIDVKDDSSTGFLSKITEMRRWTTILTEYRKQRPHHERKLGLKDGALKTDEHGAEAKSLFATITEQMEKDGRVPRPQDIQAIVQERLGKSVQKIKDRAGTVQRLQDKYGIKIKPKPTDKGQ